MVSVHDQLAPLLVDLWQGRYIVAERYDGRKLLTSRQPESKEQEEKTRARCTFLGHTTVTYCLQLGPTS
jgi:hypothetical protein